jgi:hypothetical protein
MTLPDGRSTIRLIAGVVSLVASLVVVAAGMLRMVKGLESSGYGSSPVTNALILLSAGGGLLALGISLLIWEVSIRYEIRQ